MKQIPFPNKKFGIIYSDPPWKYDFSLDNHDRVENHYPTMDLDEIKSIPVSSISEDNCVLFLWATAPKLKEAIEVMTSWGFEYRTHAIWDKAWIGMGYWFRNRHELLLVGVRGKFSPPEKQLRVPSVYKEKRRKHSQKPDYFRDMISRSFPSVNKIELFAREKVPGWDAWGNEV